VGGFDFIRIGIPFKGWTQKTRLPGTFHRARKKHMALTKVCFHAKEIEKLHLDYIIVGSDEVWNYKEVKGNAKVKFGVGLDSESLIAYAPSVGRTHEQSIPDYVRAGILKFKAVSARDTLTEELVSQIRKENIQRVVDPTFLIRTPAEPVKGVKQPYMLFYYCDGLTGDEKKQLLRYARKQGLAVYGAGECDKHYTGITVNLTPFQWVWMFRNAEFVVTGTFHGTVFSMLNHRQFACFLTNPSRIEKVSSLLMEFGLCDRKCSGKASEIIETLNREIDYEKVENLFEQRRQESRKFLKDVIQ